MKILNPPSPTFIAHRSAVNPAKPNLTTLGSVGGIAYIFACFTAWIIAAVVYVTGAHRAQVPLAILPVSVFFLGHVLIRGIRFDWNAPLTPGNLAQVMFFLQLVVIPLLIVDSGVAIGVLPYLPSATSIDTAVIIQSVAFASFVAGYAPSKRRHEKASRASSHWSNISERALGLRYPAIMGILFLVIGAIGFAQLFSNWSAYSSYLADPLGRQALFEPREGTLQGAVSTFFRPFFPFALVFFWARWVDGNVRGRHIWTAIAITMAVIGVTAVANLSYSFNRGAIIAPILAILAVFSRTIRRIPTLVLITLGIAIFFGSMILGAYRATNDGYQNTEYLTEKARIVEWIQVYGSAPQFSGFLIQHTDPEQHLRWGKTIVASLLHPVPVLGKDFRPISGVELYNRLIYGPLPSSDQVVPSAAEWFINFHYPGVVLAFVILGIVLAHCNAAFLRSDNSFMAYTIFLMSVWLAFEIMSSIAVLSQIFIYFFWPAYLYALWMPLMQQSRVRSLSER